MNKRICLMPFHQIIHRLNMPENGAGYPILIRLLPSTCYREDFGEQVNEIIEKLAGTWWEVELSAEGKMLSECLYLADSLQDALRLRLGINQSWWLAGERFTDRILSELEDSLEDDEESFEERLLG